MLIKRVLIVEEQPLYRLGLREALQHAQHLRIVGEAGNVHQALRAASHYRPHVVMVSESLPGISGLTMVEMLASQGGECISIVMMETLSGAGLAAARRAGAAAVIRRSIKPSDIPVAINRAMASGSHHLSIAAKPAESADSEQVPPLTTSEVPPARLSFKELEILDCVAHGLSNKEIANELFVTEQTVKNHMTSVFRKLEVEDRVQALLFAVRHGWVTFGPQNANAVRQRSSA